MCSCADELEDDAAGLSPRPPSGGLVDDVAAAADCDVASARQPASGVADMQGPEPRTDAIAAESAGASNTGVQGFVKQLLFLNALVFAGCLHVLHNAMHQVSEHLSRWKEFEANLKMLSALLAMSSKELWRHVSAIFSMSPWSGAKAVLADGCQHRARAE
jgi:hypothetical protein